MSHTYKKSMNFINHEEMEIKYDMKALDIP